jgi:hypothetical protein
MVQSFRRRAGSADKIGNGIERAEDRNYPAGGQFPDAGLHFGIRLAKADDDIREDAVFPKELN